jgi:hypothetical protein
MEKEIRQSNKKKKREKEKGWRQKENKNTPFPLKKPEFMPSSCFLLVFQ